jgi:hypothetical protein
LEQIFIKVFLLPETRQWLILSKQGAELRQAALSAVYKLQKKELA